MELQRRYIANKRKNIVYRVNTGKLMIIAVICLFILMLSIIFTDEPVDAHDDELSDRHKYYTCVEVAPGDSLWSIAEKHMDESYESIYDYIDELKEINDLDSDKIQDGQYLTISYYVQPY